MGNLAIISQNMWDQVIGYNDFLKIVKLWHLSIEFYGEWQEVATHHRTQVPKFDDF